MSRSKRIKAVFLTNKHTLKSEIMGGVQICSQEFRDIISAHPDIELVDYYVPFTKKLIHRARIKLGFENYSMYDIAKDKDQLISFLESEKIEILFINM